MPVHTRELGVSGRRNAAEGEYLLLGRDLNADMVERRSVRGDVLVPTNVGVTVKPSTL